MQADSITLHPPPCSHSWINPLDAPIARQSYAPIVGTGRYQMKANVVYVCRACGLTCRPMPTTEGSIVLSYKRERDYGPLQESR